jgi:hypothetical protein
MSAFSGRADIGNLLRNRKLASDALPLGIAFSPAFYKPRLTAGIDPA